MAGGASGLGEATTRALHARGANVTIADVNAEKGDALADELGEGVQFLQADVTKAEEVEAAVEAAARLFADAGATVEPLQGFLSPEMLHLQDLFWRVRSWVDFSGLSHDKQARVLPFIADWCRGGADVRARR